MGLKNSHIHTIRKKNKKLEKKAKEFVKKLSIEGANIPCDDSIDSFRDNIELPAFYDEELFKQGQAFFHKHIFCMLFGKLLGLMTILSSSGLKLLIHTKKSSSDFTAYRRYMATIFYILVWYESDFTKNSKLWKSIRTIKNFHNSASNKGYKAGIYRISQKDMAITQFGFMGIILTKSSSIGIHNATENEWKGLIHLWRVLGYLLGIDDKFNLCHGTVEETKAICNAMIKYECLPALTEHNPESVRMCNYMISGLKCFILVLNYNVFNCFLMTLLTFDQYDNNKYNLVNSLAEYKYLSFYEKFKFYTLFIYLYLPKWALFRWYINSAVQAALWMMKNYPVIAYVRFGYKRSHVRI